MQAEEKARENHHISHRLTCVHVCEHKCAMSATMGEHAEAMEAPLVQCALPHHLETRPLTEPDACAGQEVLRIHPTLSYSVGLQAYAAMSQAHAAMPSLLHRCCGFQLRSSCLREAAETSPQTSLPNFFHVL